MVFNPDVIYKRLEKMREEVKYLVTYKDMPLEDFKRNFEHFKTAERCLEIAIECSIDIANHIISQEDFKRPDRYENVFGVLAEHGIIASDFAETLKGMSRFRNLLVHEYLEIRLDRVHEKIQKNLGDFDRFAKDIVSYLEKKEMQ